MRKPDPNAFSLKNIKSYFSYFPFSVDICLIKINIRNEKTEYNIPLRLALGMMSDNYGIIDLKTPVEMKGDDVKMRNLRNIIFHAIGILFVKAAVSPFNMIADLFKVDPEALKEIHLQLTDPSPDKKNLETADILADILNNKPGLYLDFIYCYNPEKGSDTLSYLMTLENYNWSAGNLSFHQEPVIYVLQLPSFNKSYSCSPTAFCQLPTF